MLADILPTVIVSEMLKSHARDMRRLIMQKEGHHNPDLQITVQGSVERNGHQVIVEANEFLIDSIMGKHSSYEYVDNERHRRERLGPTRMRFV